jgi:uncharacterized protein YbbC (DUF1343 family)
MKHPYLLLLLCGFHLLACASPQQEKNRITPGSDTSNIALEVAPLQLGASRSELYFPQLKGKRVGLLINHTSQLPQDENSIHLLDYLLQEGIQVSTIFTPEHGFRGTADAGEKVDSGIDAKTGLPIVSLYGNNKKPSPEQLKNVDVLIFDIQDVGARFYTYISSMHYAMEACAENGKEMMVLDRPNPHGHYIDGPVLDPAFKSFVGMHPIPVVHGLTVGELAGMINKEGWLAGGATCKLTVVPMEHYTHATPYTLPVKPSPNLPNQQSILLYPSLCFFEGTPMSIGRGTPFPFQVIGYPEESFGDFSFTPVSTPGAAKNPKHENKTCYGVDLRNASAPDQLALDYLINFYNKHPQKEAFFTKFFDLLAGTDQLKKQIMEGKSEEEIRQSWEPALQDYARLREKYLLYPLD